jgi:hypothetical protein
VQNASTVTSKEEALDFIKKHGFVTLFPIRGKNFPNLYQAIVGTREEKFKKAFQWADELSVDEKKILYGKLVKGQTTPISIDILPLFYKAYQRSDFSGLPSRILAFIKQNGPTSTSELRKAEHDRPSQEERVYQSHRSFAQHLFDCCGQQRKTAEAHAYV